MSTALIVAKKLVDYIRKRKLRKDISKLKSDIEEDLEGVERVVSTAKTKSVDSNSSEWASDWKKLDSSRKEVIDLENKLDSLIIGDSILERKKRKKLLSKVESYTSTFAERIYLKEEGARVEGFNSDYVEDLSESVIPEVKKIGKAVELKSTSFLEGEKTRDNLMLALDSLERKIRDSPPIYSPHPKGEFLDSDGWDFERDEKVFRGSYKEGWFSGERFNLEGRIVENRVDFADLIDEFREGDVYSLKFLLSGVEQPYLKEQIPNLDGRKGNVILYEEPSGKTYFDEEDFFADEFSSYIEDKFKINSGKISILKKVANENGLISRENLFSTLNMSRDQLSDLKDESTLTSLPEGFYLNRI